MNKIKGLAIFTTGFVAGGLVANYLLNGKYEAIVEQEIRDIHEVRNRKQLEQMKKDALVDEAFKRIKDLDEEGMDESLPKKSSYEEVLNKENYSDRKDHFAYNKPTLEEMKRGKIKIPVIQEEEADVIEEDYHEEEDIYINREDFEPVDRTKEPYIIHVTEFYEDMPEFDKLSLMYYTEDGVLADENSEYIPTPTDIVGLEALSSFGVDSEDANIVYVRNEPISSDLEVIKVEGSYSELVVGMSPGIHHNPPE